MNQEKIADEKTLIELFQDVLKTDSAQKVLDIVDFGELPGVLNEKYETLESFEIALERVCYTKTKICFDESKKEEFINNFHAVVFEIASYDLRIQDEQRPEVISNHQAKNHTKKWMDFWSNKNQQDNYITRLNPEISISYREADEELQEKYRNHEYTPPILLKEYTNRFLQEHFTLNTTLSLNTHSTNLHLAFHETKEIAEKIDRFNEDFDKGLEQKYSKNELWYYGIDR